MNLLSSVITNLNAVVGLLVDDGDVLPSELEDDLGHGEGLVVVAGDGARKVLEALLVRQLGARREEGDLKRVSVSAVVDYLGYFNAFMGENGNFQAPD